jgi:hypothetical protein
MNTIRDTKSKRFLAALGVAAASAVAPALLFAGAGTAHADDPCYGALQYSYYCSPGISTQSPDSYGGYGTSSPNMYPALPGCTGGVLEALDGEC